jgi:hypothetical protein
MFFTCDNEAQMVQELKILPRFVIALQILSLSEHSVCSVTDIFCSKMDTKSFISGLKPV